MDFPALYAKDQKGKTLIWNISVDGNTFITSYGKIDGKQIVRPKVIEEGKNIGRANETTPDEQALAEATALWVKQRDRKGYCEDVKDWGITLFPMLARNVWNKDTGEVEQAFLDSIGPNTVWDLKIDGVRSTRERGVSYSKTRTTYPLPTSCPILAEDIEGAYRKLQEYMGEECFMDGELYIHGLKVQNIISAVRKAGKNSHRVTYRFYDIYCPGKPGMTTAERKEVLLSLNLNAFPKIEVDCPKTFVLDTPLSMMGEYLMKCIREAESDGYEGVIIRNDQSYQVGKRNSTMWKAKSRDDAEFEVIDVTRDDDYTVNGACILQGKFLCRVAESGETFSCVPRGGVKFKEHILRYPERFKGRFLNVAFHGWTDRGVPATNPVGRYFRGKEDMSHELP
ncbi:ATP-dependent DNA ligase [Candidatus Pacearchaeota archaeon]|nr:ATP-dependent DNA ligase [Candidatus Pacearchaeota archaeon]